MMQRRRSFEPITLKARHIDREIWEKFYAPKLLKNGVILKFQFASFATRIIAISRTRTPFFSKKGAVRMHAHQCGPPNVGVLRAFFFWYCGKLLVHHGATPYGRAHFGDFGPTQFYAASGARDG